jgi:hypothetical protein
VIEYSKETDLKNISEFLGLGGWYTACGVSVPPSLPQRPKQFNSYGKETTVMLNTFNLVKAPTTVTHQYNVSSAFLLMLQWLLTLSSLYKVAMQRTTPNVYCSRRSGTPRK